jgi:hypothetical protein
MADTRERVITMLNPAVVAGQAAIFQVWRSQADNHDRLRVCGKGNYCADEFLSEATRTLSLTLIGPFVPALPQKLSAAFTVAADSI